tara:strand:- start:8288 stop:8695 length:408 start_codon:yes stop_codon:yes gene_type:complete
MTKRILSLAEADAKQTIKESSFWTEKDLNKLTQWNSEELTRIKNALLRGRFYCGVDSVSKSGMSRKIRLAYIYKNKLRKITDPYILKLAGCDKNGRISGCGMDMLFKAQYNLFQNLHRSYKEAHYQKRMPSYNNL